MAGPTWSSNWTLPTGWIAEGSQQTEWSVTVSSMVGNDYISFWADYRLNGGAWTSTGQTHTFNAAGTWNGSHTLNGLAAGDVVEYRLKWAYWDQGRRFPSSDYYYGATKTYTVTPLPTAPTTNTTASGYHDQTPTVSWSGATNAQTYDISYDTGGGTPNDTPDQTGLTSAQYTFLTVAKGAIINWKVRAVNLNGTSDWSSVFTTLVADDPVEPTIDETGTYVDDGETETELRPTLAWTENGSGASEATAYDVYLDNQDATTRVSENQTAKTYTPPNDLQVGFTYYWKVVAKNAVGDAISAVYSFTTAGVPAATPSAKTYKRRLWAIAGNRFYYENDDSPNPKMVLLEGLALDTTKRVQAFEAFRKVFIANDDKKVVVDFSNIKLTLQFTPQAGHEPARGDTISTAGGAAMLVDYWDGDKTVYGFQTTTTDFADDTVLLLNGAAWKYNGADDEKTAVSNCQLDPTVPHYYDWKEFGGTETNMPTYATVAALYRGRASLAGNSADPNVFYLGRNGNPHDFEYAADDYQSPIAGNGVQYGKIGDTITALAGYLDDYLFVGCSQSLWIIRGDPAAGGVIDQLSREANCFGPSSWAVDDRGDLWVLGTNAIHQISQAGRLVDNKTRDRIPTLVEDLKLSADVHQASVGIDRQSGGILFAITKLTDGTNECYWYDPRVDGFFPDTYPTSCGPYSQVYYEADSPLYRTLLIGSRDGCIRAYDHSQKYDQAGTPVTENDLAIDSAVLLGPLALSEDHDRRVRVNEVALVLAGGGAAGTQPDADQADYGLYVGDDAETIIEAYDAAEPFESGSITGPGRSRRMRPHMRTGFVGVGLGLNTSQKSWAMEEVLVTTTKPLGRGR